MKYRKTTLAMTLCFILIGSLSCRKENSNTRPPDITGKWKSIELGGTDMGGHIKEVRYDFRKDESVTIQGTTADGSNMELTGSYTLSETTIKIVLNNGDSQVLPYKLEDGVLIIEDPQLNSWIKFEKI